MIWAFPVVFCSLLVVRSVAPAVASYNHHKWWLVYGDQRLWIQTAHLSTAAMESKFKEHSVVPDVLDDVPPQLAEVKCSLYTDVCRICASQNQQLCTVESKDLANL